MKRLALTFGGCLVVVLTGSNARAKGCTEVSDVVGEQKCSRYGAGWSIERSFPITFRFGLRYAEFSTSGATFKEQFKKKHRPKGYRGYSFSGDTLGVPRLSGIGMDGGVTLFLVGQLYSGGEVGVGFGSFHRRTFTTGKHTLSNHSGVNVTIVHGGVPIGYRIPLGRASLRGEMFMGFVSASVSHDVRAPTIPEAPSAASAGAVRWLVEPRVAADIWFTQHVSFGVYGGVNLVDTGGRVLGLSLTYHHRAFDGDVSLW